MEYDYDITGNNTITAYLLYPDLTANYYVTATATDGSEVSKTIEIAKY